MNRARRVLLWSLIFAVAAMLGLLSAVLRGQSNVGVTIVVPATPSGTCSNPQIRYVTPGGALYTCQNGTWAAAGGGGTFNALSGDATSTATGGATTVSKINGTSVPTNSAADQFLGTSASATAGWVSVANCVANGGVIQYATATHAFSCHTLVSADIPNNGANTSGTAAGLSATLATGSGGTGVANTATLTLGSSNQNWATLGTGIVKNTTTTGALSDAAAADVYGLWSGTKDSSHFLAGDGTMQTAGTGTRSYPYIFQGYVQAGVSGFALNLPAASSPVPTNAGGTMPSAVLEWPVSQSTYYAWATFPLPTGYTSNAAISYSLESRCNVGTCDSTNATIVTLGWGCAAAAASDAPGITNIAPVNVTNGTAGVRTLTTGTITPTCAATNRVWVRIIADTNTNSLTGPFDLISATFSVQGGM